MTVEDEVRSKRTETGLYHHTTFHRTGEKLNSDSLGSSSPTKLKLLLKLWKKKSICSGLFWLISVLNYFIEEIRLLDWWPTVKGEDVRNPDSSELVL